MSYGRGVVSPERGRFRVRIPNGKGGYISCGTRPTRPEAEALLDALLLERDGAAIAPSSTLLEYGYVAIERWRAAGLRDTPNMRSRWGGIVGRAPFAHDPLPAIDRRAIRDWARSLPSQHATRALLRGGKVERVVELDRCLSWETCQRALVLVSRVLGEALEDELVTENVARGAKLPKRTERSEGWTWLTPDELDAVLALELTDAQRLAITLSVYQGLRQGELASLQWSGIDLAGGWLVVSSSWGRPTKSGKVRRIPLLAPSRAALELVPASRRFGLVLPDDNGEMRGKGYDHGWSGHYRGAPRLPELAGIARRVRWHDLRHTCGSSLISGLWGEAWTIEEVREYLGHADSKTTRRYAHLAPDALHATASRTAQPVADLPQEIAEAAKLLLDFRSRLGLTLPSDPSDSADLSAKRQVCGRSAAEAVLRAVADGQAPADRELVALALSTLPVLELRALTRDHRAAVELAAAALPDAADAPHPKAGAR